ncbi:hypothetical protein BH23CHL8_BH23CHL8_07200 [soil metagenome]
MHPLVLPGERGHTLRVALVEGSTRDHQARRPMRHGAERGEQLGHALVRPHPAHEGDDPGAIWQPQASSCLLPCERVRIRPAVVAVRDDAHARARSGGQVESLDDGLPGRAAVGDENIADAGQRAHEGALLGVLVAVVPEEVVGRPDEPRAGASQEAQLGQRALGLEPADPPARRDVRLGPVQVEDVRAPVRPHRLQDRQHAPRPGGVGGHRDPQGGERVTQGPLVGVGRGVVGQEEDLHVCGPAPTCEGAAPRER